MNVLTHLVFSTKDRRNSYGLTNRKNSGDLSPGIAKKILALVCLLRVECRITFNSDRFEGDDGLSEFVHKLKASSSNWMSQTTRDFAWQQGFGAFGVSASHREDVIAYIRNQPEHHKKRSFEEEFIAFLKAAGVEYDPRYVFG